MLPVTFRDRKSHHLITEKLDVVADFRIFLLDDSIFTSSYTSVITHPDHTLDGPVMRQNTGVV